MIVLGFGLLWLNPGLFKNQTGWVLVFGFSGVLSYYTEH